MVSGLSAAVTHSFYNNVIILIKLFKLLECQALFTINCHELIINIHKEHFLRILMRGPSGWTFSNIGMDFVFCSPLLSSCPPRAALEFIESLNPVHSRLLSQTWGIFQWPLVPGWEHQVSAQSQVYRGMKKMVCDLPWENKPNAFI